MSLIQQTHDLQSFIQSHANVSSISDSDELHYIYGKLIDCLVDNNHLYYVESAPIISDKEYDDLFAYLKKIEELHPEIISSNSPTQGLIGQVSDGFLQAKHTVKLASLENTYNAEDLKNWDERIHKVLEKNGNNGFIVDYIVEPKFDGLSVELIYEKGILKQAITRGDGRVGEDVTINVKTIKNIPHKLKNPIDLSVRGEIMMPKSIRKELNKEREEEGDIPFANTRNAASGSIKLLDSKEVSKRGLVCFVYDILNNYGNEIVVDNMAKIGLPIFDRNKTYSSINEVIDLCNNIETKKYFEGLDFDFDGLVIKIKQKNIREIVGSTDHHPRRAVAYKFPAQLASTKILSVDFQVGRTGIITPVANLEPIELSGVTIKRVSLHNFDFIQSKDLHIGDYVWIQRSGEVIPYIVSVIKERRRDSIQDINMPKLCPSCSGKIKNEDIHYYCVNSQCPAKLKEQILHFVSKQCMDIQGIGESVVDILVDQGMVKRIEDIYTLPDHKNQILLRKFPGFGDKKIIEIMNEIEISKKQPLWRLLNGLGIPHVGKKMAQDIVQAVVTQQPVCLEDIIYILSDREFLITIYGIGEKTLDALADYFSNKDHQDMLISLRDIGMSFSLDSGGYDLFKDKKETFSITGSFPFSREQIVTEFEKQGYIFHDIPLKSTQLMLVGDKPGSKKEKAQEFGIIMYEGWENILRQFEFLNSLKAEIKINNQAQKIVQQGLF